MTDKEAYEFLRIVYASEEKAKQEQLIAAWLVVRKIPSLGGPKCFSDWANRLCWGIAAELMGAGTGVYEEQTKQLGAILTVLQNLVGEDMFKVTIDFSYLRGFSGRATQVHLASRSIFMTSNNSSLLREIYTFLALKKFKCLWVTDGDRNGIRISGRDSLIRWRDKIGFPDKERTVRLAAIIGEKK